MLYLVTVCAYKSCTPTSGCFELGPNKVSTLLLMSTTSLLLRSVYEGGTGVVVVNTSAPVGAKCVFKLWYRISMFSRYSSRVTGAYLQKINECQSQTLHSIMCNFFIFFFFFFFFSTTKIYVLAGLVKPKSSSTHKFCVNSNANANANANANVNAKANASAKCQMVMGWNVRTWRGRYREVPS